MNKDIVKYDNDMNTVTFGKFKEKELDLFFSICFKVRDMGVKKVILSFSELKELSNYSNRNISRFIKDLSSTYDKMLGLNIKIMHSELSFTKFNLFSEYTVNAEEKTIIIQVHEKFEYILNKMLKEGNYTKFELIEFVNLRSSYSKNMFRLLKQWESKKTKKFTIEEFRELLVVPPKYRMSEIDKFILAPIIQELSNFFPNLELEKIKTGRKITHLKFSWRNKKQKIKEVEKVEIEISERLNKVIQKTRKNRFIEPLLINENIEKLINSFNEEELIKGLNWAYKEIKKEVISINYLIKTIKTGAEKVEKKLIIKEAINPKEVILDKESIIILENSKIEIPEKIIVTQGEYEEIYKNHLKENGIVHNKVTRLAFEKSMESKYIIGKNRKKIQEELIRSLYIIFLGENNLVNNNENDKKFKKYLEDNFIITNNFEDDKEWNDFLEFQDEISKKESYIKAKEFNQDLTFEDYLELIKDVDINDGVDSLGEVLSENKEFKEEFKFMYSPLNDNELKKEIETRQKFSDFFKDKPEYKLDWMENEIILEELKETMKIKNDNIINLEDIPEEKLLSKSGKVLKGGALISRLEKIAREEKIKIQYKNKVIKIEK